MKGDISIFYHSRGGVHSGLYHRKSSGVMRKIKAVNPKNYIPLKHSKEIKIYDWG